MNEIFVGIFELNEAKHHQINLKSLGVELTFKTHPQTCQSGCKTQVEVWSFANNEDLLKNYFHQEYLKNLKGHEINTVLLQEVFDSSASEVICQACGNRFSPIKNECPDCGLVY
jgi:hypothetical protein